MKLISKIITLLVQNYIEEIKTYGLESEALENDIDALDGFEEWLLELT